jgi:hypothetical protein
MFGRLYLSLSETCQKIKIWDLAARFSRRTIIFATFFALTGFGLACYGKLTDAYALLVTAIQGFVLAHSFKDDWKECRSCPDTEQGKDKCS